MTMKSILCLLFLPMSVASPVPGHGNRPTAVTSAGANSPFMAGELRSTTGPSGLESAALAAWSSTHQDAAFRQQSGGAPSPFFVTAAALPATNKAAAVQMASRLSSSDLLAKLSQLGSPLYSLRAGAFPMHDVSAATSPMGVLSPVNVAADYAVFGSGGQGGGLPQASNPDPSGAQDSLPTADSLPLALQSGDTGGQQSHPNHPKDSHAHPPASHASLKPAGASSYGTTAPGAVGAPSMSQQPTNLQQSAAFTPRQQSVPAAPRQIPVFNLQYSVQQDPNAPQRAEETALLMPVPVAPPIGEQLRKTNLFVMGVDKQEQQQQHTPDLLASSSVNGTVRGPKGLRLFPGFSSHAEIAAPLLATELRAPCNNLVDALFVLDDVSSIWLIRESIRHYQTQLLASPNARFGIVLCGNIQTFYTNLYSHFSALLASLEDLQHANATLDPAEQMPDTPGYRGDNNPYPPRVSEDFTFSNAGCLETVFHLLSYSSQKGSPVPERLVSIMGTKERWSDPVVLEEAKFLRSLNYSLLTLADGQLSAQAHSTLQNMASTPDKFRSVTDNVTMHALPTMIGNAVCRPQKADVTVTVQRTQTMKLHEPTVTGCRQVSATTLERATDFGRFFGSHVDHVTCAAGVIPNLQKCSCAYNL